MRILVVSPLVYGKSVGKGGGVLCYGQLKCLADTHEVHFVSFRDGGADSEQMDRLVKDLGSYCAIDGNWMSTTSGRTVAMACAKVPSISGVLANAASRG